MEAQAKLLEMGTHYNNNLRKQTQNRNMGYDGQNLEWICQNESGSRHSQNKERNQERLNWKAKRLELPPFNVQDPDEWILKAKKYFTFYQLNEKEEVESSVVSFEGEAMMWYRWMNQRTSLKPWEDLKMLILEHFRSGEDGHLYEQWMSVEKMGTVAKYRKEFVTRLTYLDPVDEPVMLDAFLRGL